MNNDREFIIGEIKSLVCICKDNTTPINTRNKLRYELNEMKDDIDKTIIQCETGDFDNININ
jgi:hypothetical protein